MLRLRRLWNDKRKLSDYIDFFFPKKIALPFGHGLGDLILFINPFHSLCDSFPEIEFTLVLQKNLGFEDLLYVFEGTNRKVVFSDDLSYNNQTDDYDIIADIDFPMSENQTALTKAEFCCINELGINPVSGHCPIVVPDNWNRLIAVHFNITCLPDASNPDAETAELIWNEILEAGFIPIESHFQHMFHNPVNAKFDFVDCTVRRCRPQISSLAGLLSVCRGFVGVVSGNFHTALSVMDPKSIFLLEKHLRLECFTKLPIAKTSILPNEYKKGSVKEWLLSL